MLDMEMVFFKMIASLGNAKSLFMEAIKLAKKGDFEAAREKIADGEVSRLEAHEQHFDLLQQEAQDIKVEITLLLVHVEDQLMSTETIKIMAEEFIELYEKILDIK